MCGIFAYLNFRIPKTRRAILRLLLDALQCLEPRGCDSAGLAVDDDSLKEGVAFVFRALGKVEALEEVVQEASRCLNLERAFESHLGIAHTRWATHGAPSPDNAHPQSSSPKQEFLVVHNGIITNDGLLRDFLRTKGFTFQSDTDTEVIPKLCLHFYRERGGRVGFPELVNEVLLQLEGPFGVVFKSAYYPHELVAARSGSALYISKSSDTRGKFSESDTSSGSDTEASPRPVPANEFFVTSDTAPLVAFGRHVHPLEDGDVVHIKNGRMKLFNVNPNQALQRVSSRARFLASFHRNVAATELEVLLKNSHRHFMLKEICEQPETLRNGMRGRVNFAAKAVKLGGIETYKDTISRARRIVILSLGSGFYGALAVRNALEELIDIPISIELACDYPERRPPIFRDDVCCFVNFSGDNSIILELLDYCKGRGALCVGFTNVVGSPLALRTDCGVYLHAGYEVGVSRTKAFTSAIVALLMFALAVSEDNRGALARREAIFDALQRLPQDVEVVLRTSAQMEALATEFAGHNNFLCLGRGHQRATSMQAALNLKEAALVHSEGIHLGELKHGPLALVDEEMPVIVLCTREDCGTGEAMYPKVKSSLQQVLARHGRPIVIANEDEGEDASFWEEVHTKIVVPKTMDCLQTVVNVIPLQLLAYHLAVKRGIDPDREANYKLS